MAKQTDSTTKLQQLHRLSAVKEFFLRKPHLAWEMGALSSEEQIAFKSIVAIGQGDIVFRIPKELEDWLPRLRHLLATLIEVEDFYAPLGGIIGYHNKILELIRGLPASKRTYQHPQTQDIEMPGALRWGIEAVPQMAEIYPIGGAGDRLGLVDEETGEALPAACLPFAGRTLLEGMIRDLSGREELYFKLTGERVITPIALMTSHEKENDRRLRAICEEQGWFGRPRSSFRFFPQCLVPVITEEGNWAMSDALTLVLKPGGHGVLWKHMLDAGIFRWLKDRKIALVRQVNNPICGVDGGLLAFIGIGVHEKRVFGFSACKRLPGRAEGMDVLISEDGRFCLTNVEYTELAREGLEDADFPANTNILYVDLAAAESAVQKCMLPSPLINMKHKAPYIDAQGKKSEVHAGRLESTMQNLADQFWAESAEALPTYVTEGRRERTISVTKKLVGDEETPVTAWESVCANARELLQQCGMQVEGRLHSLYHPALGPLYTVIAQKIRGGRIAEGAELQLEIAELDLANLDLDGSLLLEARDPLAARCRLHDVTVRNEGIDWALKNLPWANQMHRSEALHIQLRGNGEFEAHGVTFRGNFAIEVPDGTRIIAEQDGENVRLRSEPITGWQWNYSWDGDAIKLNPG